MKKIETSEISSCGMSILPLFSSTFPTFISLHTQIILYKEKKEEKRDFMSSINHRNESLR